MSDYREDLVLDLKRQIDCLEAQLEEEKGEVCGSRALWNSDDCTFNTKLNLHSLQAEKRN